MNDHNQNIAEYIHDQYPDVWRHAEKELEVPSAEPEHLTNEDMEAIRIHLSAIREELVNQRRWNEAKEYEGLIDRFIASASAERKGKWIRHTRVEPVYSIDGVETWGIKCQCNKCCFTTTAVEDFGYYNYCPNCGADMRGEEE